MKKTFEIRAWLEKKVEDGIVLIRITRETMADDMCEALVKARTYIRLTERDKQAICSWMTVEEAQDA